MKRLVKYIALLLPLFANAQKEVFMQQLNTVNNGFFTQQHMVLIQRYSYYKDTTMTKVADSSKVTIIKNGTAICYRAGDAESFSDKGYTIKINRAGHAMYVSKTDKPDSGQLKAIFNQGFAAYSGFKKISNTNGTSTWQLTGGVTGVTTAVIAINIKVKQIKYLLMILAQDNPLVRAYQKPGEDNGMPVMVKITYKYRAAGIKDHIETLSDIISTANAQPVPGAKYKGYSLQMMSK